MCCYFFSSSFLFYFYFFYLHLIYLISEKLFEFNNVFDKWKIWSRERERERPLCVCVGGGGFVWRKVKEKENKYEDETCVWLYVEESKRKGKIRR